jgi:hypothetical protein
MAKKSRETKTDTSTPQQATNGQTEAKPVKYIVVRDGYRVSDKEYASAQDLAAIAECEFWEKVAKNHSHGERVDIVQYDSKKHRVW